MQSNVIYSIHFSQIYWFGDMNYRIDLECDIIKSSVEDMKKEGSRRDEILSSLLQWDQLICARDVDKKVFTGFSEGIIRFIPTYKYDPGSLDRWDSSDKNRPPAWTDRIMWSRRHPHSISSCSTSTGVTSTTGQWTSYSPPPPSEAPLPVSRWEKKDLDPVLIEYRSHPRITVSDHKPVSALFRIPIKIVDSVKSRRVYTELMKRLDRLENDYLPQVMLDKTDLDFGQIQLLTPLSKSFTIANTGQVPVTWSFSNKPNALSFCKEFLHVTPSRGFIVPGDAEEVQVTILVHPKMVNSLKSHPSLSDILVLHLERGRDLFITVSGSYLTNLMDL